MRTANRVRMQANMERTRRILAEVKQKEREEALDVARLALVLVIASLKAYPKPRPWYRKIF